MSLENLKKITKKRYLLVVCDDVTIKQQHKELFNPIFKKVDFTTDASNANVMIGEYGYIAVIIERTHSDLSGIACAKEILKEHPKQRTLILSADEDREKLLQAYQMGISGYLIKPVAPEALLKKLYAILVSQTKEQRQERIKKQYQISLDSQAGAVILLTQNKISFANKSFFKLFGVKNIIEFHEHYKDLGECFVKEIGYLYSNNDESWIEKLQKDNDKSHFVKFRANDGKIHDYLLTYDGVENNPNNAVVSITHINRQEIKHTYQAQMLPKTINPETLFPHQEGDDDDVYYKWLREAAFEKRILKIISSYKGISITNKCVITYCDKTMLRVHTTASQIKAAEMIGSFIVHDELHNMFFLCKGVEDIDVIHDTMTSKQYEFFNDMRTKRISLRVEPGGESKVQLYVNEEQVLKNVDLTLIDISKEAVKIKSDEITKRLTKAKQIGVSLQLSDEETVMDVECKAKFFNVYDLKDHYHIVLKLDFTDQDQEKIMEYISLRQKLIIDEFKKLKKEGKQQTITNVTNIV